MKLVAAICRQYHLLRFVVLEPIRANINKRTGKEVDSSDIVKAPPTAKPKVTPSANNVAAKLTVRKQA